MFSSTCASALVRACGPARGARCFPAYPYPTLPCLLVMPVRVPVRGCARVIPLKPCESFVPVLCLLSPTLRPCLLQPMLFHARSWPPARGGPAMSRVCVES